MLSPARTWSLLAALSAATALGAILLASALDHQGSARSAGPSGYPMAKIDVHQHVGPASLPDAVRLAGAQGIIAMVNLSGGWAGGELEQQLAAAASFPGKVHVFMNLDFRGCCDDAWQRREVARLALGKAEGARGLKIFKALGLEVRDATGPGAGALAARVPVDSPKLDPIWQACAELSLPVAIHTGDPKAFFEPLGPGNERAEELRESPEWSYADRSRYPGWATLHDELVRLVERHPRTTFIGVHFGNDAEDPAAVSQLLDRLPNLYVDTAARVPELGRRAEATRAAILAHPDRVLFGTDLQWIEGPGVEAVVFGAGRPGGPDEMHRFFDGAFRFFETRDRSIPSPTPIQGRWTIDGIGLPREVLERVYRRNAERLLGLRGEAAP